MDFHDPAFFGDRWAATHDDLSAGPDPAAAVGFLAGLAPPGARVLELAIGGGRVALPLARRGYAVEGVEASGAVADRLRGTPGGADLPVLVADMAHAPVRGPFALVYVVWNSLFNITDQARQVACFRTAARVLAPGGAFVLECYVPDPQRYDRGTPETDDVTEDSATMTLVRHDRVRQVITQQHITFTAAGTRFLPVAHRYCWPAELDLMAELAGLRRRERWADWDRSPFTATSPSHVTVYEPAA